MNLESGRSAVRMYSNGLNTTINIVDSEATCTGTVGGCFLYLTTSSQTLHVKNSKIRASDYATVVNNSGKIMIDDSQLYGNAEYSNVRNRGTGMITIRNSYIENQRGYGIATNDSSSLTIEGEEVTFTVDHQYENGMYVYVPLSHNIYNTSLGTIEVKGGTMESASGIWTNSTGKIYICGGNLSAPNNIISRGENGYIYYKTTGIDWNNGSIPSITGEFPQNVIVDDSMICNP